MENLQTEIIENVAQPNAKEYEIEFLGNKETVTVNFDNDDEVKQILQKSKNNDRITEKWEQSKSKLSELEEVSRQLGYFNGDGHGDIDAMIKATKENLTKAEIQQIAIDKSTEEIAEELLNSRIKLTEYDAIIQERNVEKQKQKDYSDFMEGFERLNGRKFDDRTDLIPLEVWTEVGNGTPLKYAYAEFFANDISKKNAIAQKNLENKETSTGNVASSGNHGVPSFTKEEVKGMSREEVQKNYDAITKSMKNWNK